MVNWHHIYIQELLSPPIVWVYKTPLQDWPSQLHVQRWQVLCISKFGHILKNFGCFDFMYADIIFRLAVQPRWHFKIFILQKILWKVHHPKKAQVAVVMHEGILRSRVSASLLQGNMVPKIRSLFFKGEAV